MSFVKPILASLFDLCSISKIIKLSKSRAVHNLVILVKNLEFIFFAKSVSSICSEKLSLKKSFLKNLKKSCLL